MTNSAIMTPISDFLIGYGQRWQRVTWAYTNLNSASTLSMQNLTLASLPMVRDNLNHD